MAATNEVQTITLSGTPQAGSFTISFNGQVTDAIAWNADAAAITAALEALSNIGTGDVGVSISGSVITLTFQGNLRYQDQPEVSVSSSLYIPAIKSISFSAAVAGGNMVVKPISEFSSTCNAFGAGASLGYISGALASADWTGRTIDVTGDWTTGFTFTFNNNSDPGIIYEAGHDFTDSNTDPVTVTLNDSVQAYSSISATVATTTEGVGPTVTLSVDTNTIAENAGVAIVTATITDTLPFDATATLGLTGTATDTVDYSVSDTVITIPAGQTSGSITVTSINDALNDPGETVILSITETAWCVEETEQSVTVTLQQASGAVVDLSTTTASIVENGGITFVRALLSQTAASNVTVNLSCGGTAISNTDYTLSTNSIVIASGSTSGSISVTALNDTLAEGNQTVIFDFSVTNGTKGTTTSITIIDDDPVITLDSDISSFHEANDIATIFAYSSFTKSWNIVVDLAFDGTATDVDDYSRSGSSITIPAGSTSGSMQIVALVDAVSDANETIIVSIDTITNAVESGTQSLTLTILDVSDTSSPSTQVGLGLKLGLGL